MRETVFLDLYGTLVEPDWAVLLQGRTALAERIRIPAAAAHRAWDTTHAARMKGAYGSLVGDLAAVFSDASDGMRSLTTAGLLSQLADEERQNWRRGVKLYPDALPALMDLRSLGLRLAIVTNSSAEAAGVVDELAIRPRVDDVFASCEAGVLKPELLELALQAMGLAASDATLVDDEPAQLDGAARLGIGTVLIQRESPDAYAATNACPYPAVSDLRQVAELVTHKAPARRR